MSEGHLNVNLISCDPVLARAVLLAALPSCSCLLPDFRVS